MQIAILLVALATLICAIGGVWLSLRSAKAAETAAVAAQMVIDKDQELKRNLEVLKQGVKARTEAARGIRWFGRDLP
jgi:hypothetical protein